MEEEQGNIQPLALKGKKAGCVRPKAEEKNREEQKESFEKSET